MKPDPFTSVPFDGMQASQSEAVRDGCRQLLALIELLPQNPERTLAIRHLEDCGFRCQRAIAVGEVPRRSDA
jgi:hypothetical protein